MPILDSCLNLFSRHLTHGILYKFHFPEEVCSGAFWSAPVPQCMVYSPSSWCLYLLSFWVFLLFPVFCVSYLPLSWFALLFSWNTFTSFFQRKGMWEENGFEILYVWRCLHSLLTSADTLFRYQILDWQ